MGLSHRQWRRLVTGTVFFAIADTLWTLLAFGKTELLSWRGAASVAVTSVLFFLIMLWLTSARNSDENKDEQ